MKKSKLIKEYELKVLTEDSIIERMTGFIRQVDRSLETQAYVNETMDYGIQRKQAYARRQCYIQFIVDLKAL